jgi:hypothetical protein
MVFDKLAKNELYEILISNNQVEKYIYEVIFYDFFSYLFRDPLSRKFIVKGFLP